MGPDHSKAVQATIMTLDVTLSQMESLRKQRIICYRGDKTCNILPY